MKSESAYNRKKASLAWSSYHLHRKLQKKIDRVHAMDLKTEFKKDHLQKKMTEAIDRKNKRLNDIVSNISDQVKTNQKRVHSREIDILVVKGNNQIRMMGAVERKNKALNKMTSVLSEQLKTKQERGNSVIEVKEATLLLEKARLQKKMEDTIDRKTTALEKLTTSLSGQLSAKQDRGMKSMEARDADILLLKKKLEMKMMAAVERKDIFLKHISSSLSEELHAKRMRGKESKAAKTGRLHEKKRFEAKLARAEAKGNEVRLSQVELMRSLSLAEEVAKAGMENFTTESHLKLLVSVDLPTDVRRNLRRQGRNKSVQGLVKAPVRALGFAVRGLTRRGRVEK